MMKVSFKQDHIYQNGQCVGHLSGGRDMCYVILYPSELQKKFNSIQTKDGYSPWLHEGSFGARFKYRSPRTSAKKFIKTVLQQLTVEAYLKGIENSTPVEFARSQGLDV